MRSRSVSSWAKGPARVCASLVALLLLTLLSTQETKAATPHITGVVTHTGNVTDLLATSANLFVATRGGIEEYDRTTRQHLRTYTHLDGLPSIEVQGLSRRVGGSLVAHVKGHDCELRGRKFLCKKAAAASAHSVRIEYEGGTRITRRMSLREGEWIGTASRGALLGGRSLGTQGLPGPHVTALAVFRNQLWVGTFNQGLARKEAHGRFTAVTSAGNFINALHATKNHLYVGTSEGLFRSTTNGFERVAFVEDAVVGLAHDGTSLWASTPGALYRIKDDRGPASDVWWVPGGSRSLQKVSASPGFVWIGTEDRGAVLMRPTTTTMAKDKPFTVFDRAAGLNSSWSLAVAAWEDGSALMTTLREGTTFIDKNGSHRSVALPVGSWGLSTYVEASGVWVGTQDGAAHFDPKSGTSARIVGLPDERVHAILRDPRDGRVYFGTENGLAWL